MNLTEHRDRALTLSELAELAGRLLDLAQLSVEDGRVGATLDERTLRYHQTLGLLDKPARYEGRQAIYGYRHLLQAMSVRVLQARGYSLARVQGALLGVGTEALESALLRDLEPQPPDVPAQAPAVVPSPPARGVAAEVAPGVTVVLDSRHSADAERIFAAISALFSSGGSR